MEAKSGEVKGRHTGFTQGRVVVGVVTGEGSTPFVRAPSDLSPVGPGSCTTTPSLRPLRSPDRQTGEGGGGPTRGEYPVPKPLSLERTLWSSNLVYQIPFVTNYEIFLGGEGIC